MKFHSCLYMVYDVELRVAMMLYSLSILISRH